MIEHLPSNPTLLGFDPQYYIEKRALYCNCDYALDCLVELKNISLPMTHSELIKSVVQTLVLKRKFSRCFYYIARIKNGWFGHPMCPL
jgi:hypothetical protein